ncbi:MAG: 4-hydroxy-tetrahydrodipicolinate reductase [Elusimicrobia bacterium]|nr:MAG: 4-hydroxy-tetrahydrodipicolinate reductase [Elusimicrobiota bacterium]
MDQHADTDQGANDKNSFKIIVKNSAPSSLHEGNQPLYVAISLTFVILFNGLPLPVKMPPKPAKRKVREVKTSIISSMAKSLRILLGGATGRMGQAVTGLAENDRRFTIIGGIHRDCKNPGPFLKKTDIIIDFSLPGPSLNLLRAAAKAKIPFVTGTTGFSKAQTAEIKNFSKRIPILASPNMSPGMNLLFALARMASNAFPLYDVSVFEIHHTKKKDAPSGSALQLIKALERKRVPASSLRLGTVVGDHTVHLAGPDERIELTHRAQDRSVFARGALEAARWLKTRRRPGLYSMANVLGL